MPYISMAGMALGALASYEGSKSSKGASASGGNYYIPTGSSGADSQWQGLSGGYGNEANNLYGSISPYYQNSLAPGEGMVGQGQGYATGSTVPYLGQAGAFSQTGANTLSGAGVANYGTAMGYGGDLSSQAGLAGNSAMQASDYISPSLYASLGNSGLGLMNQGTSALGQSSAYGNQSGQYANGAIGTANTLQNPAQQVFGAGQTVAQMALDPQNQLYQQQLQQTENQANAVNSMYGLGNSATGAGATNEALLNFNTNWENQQLGRAESGVNTLASAYQPLANSASTSVGAQENAAGNALGQGNLGLGINSGYGSQENNLLNYGSLGSTMAGTSLGQANALTNAGGLYYDAGGLGNSALGAESGAYGTAGGLYGEGAGYESAIPGEYYGAATMPYGYGSAYSTAMGGAMAPQGQMMGYDTGYLGLSTPNGGAMGAMNSQNNLGMSGLMGLTGSLFGTSGSSSGMGGIFNSGGGTGLGDMLFSDGM